MSRHSEFVLLAQKGVAEGFIRGYFRGRGDDSLIINLEREEIERETIKEIITEFMHPAEEIVHLLIPENKEDIFKDALSALRKEGLVCKEKAVRKRSKLKAKFTVKIYVAKSGIEIKKILSEQKEIKISFDKELVEIEREKKEKVELYAPEHSYELFGSGTVEGDIEPVFKFIQKLRELSVEIKEISF
ncbi:MAG: hypothetical protein N2445_03165 [Acidobacteria bacterium]|nr:hypothetical protein [Acidobacteriota bacterium]